MSVKVDNYFDNDEIEINKTYEKYRDEIIKISNDLRIEEFKEKLNKLREKENIIFRIKSIDKTSFTSNLNNSDNIESNDKKYVIEYFDSCLKVIIKNKNKDSF